MPATISIFVFGFPADSIMTQNGPAGGKWKPNKFSGDARATTLA